jgi:WD40 repeat protein
MVQRYTGQRQEKNVIRGCFGGVKETFVLTGSDDGQIYVWHRDSGALLEILKGHGKGSVNCVAWHPKENRLFASCSDDHTVHVWEPPPVFEVEENLSSVEEAETIMGEKPLQPQTSSAQSAISSVGEKGLTSPRITPTSHSPTPPPNLTPAATALRNEMITTPSPTGSDELVIGVTV